MRLSHDLTGTKNIPIQKETENKTWKRNSHFLWATVIGIVIWLITSFKSFILFMVIMSIIILAGRKILQIMNFFINHYDEDKDIK